MCIRDSCRPTGTGQCMKHAPAVLAAPALYCIHGRSIHQAKDRQTVQNVNEKYTPSPPAATANTHWPSNCSTSNKGRCMVHTLAGAAGMWFIGTVLTKYEAQHKSDRNSSSAQRYDGASRIHDNRLPYNKHILQILTLYEFCPGFTNPNDNFYLL